MSENGKWSLAFWIVTGFIVAVFALMVPCIINNDRIRASEDQRVEEKMEKEYKTQTEYIHQVDNRLARLEAKIDQLLEK